MDGPTIISGLPDSLRIVPPSPSGPDDPDRDKKRKAWLQWRDSVNRYGEARRKACESDKSQRDLELEKCANDRAYFLTIWCVLYEPRRRKAGASLPRFIPFEKQVQMSYMLDQCLVSEEGPEQDLAVSKCRDVGATWIYCAYAIHDWLFIPNTSIGFLSRNEFYVDSKSMKSCFAKIRYLLKHLPAWLLPPGFKPGVHINKLLIQNPANDSELWGETTTTESARGSRASWILVDEAAFIRGFSHVWAGTASAADTRIALSTESFKMGTDFRDLWQGKNAELDKPQVMEVDWWDNPFFTNQWYINMKRRMASTPNEFAIEIERNPFNGSEVFVYPEAREATPDAQYGYDPSLPLIASLDPGQRDDFAILFIQENPADGTTRVVDGYSRSGRPADYFGTILTSTPNYDKFYGEHFGYDSEALRIMEFLKGKQLSEVYGDVAGRSREGATMQSTYDVLAEYGIRVIFDRMDTGEIAQSKAIMRTYEGRRRAVHSLFPRLRFADTPGAVRALDAIGKYRFGEQNGTSESTRPKHDDNSHYATALEYFAVNRAWYAIVNAMDLKPARKMIATRRNWMQRPRKMPALEGLQI